MDIGASGVLESIEALTPTSDRFRLAGPALARFKWQPGDNVRLRIGSMVAAVLRLRPHDSVRTYSIWDGDPQAGTVDLVLYDHGTPGSIGLDWARAARVGQEVGFLRGSRPVRLKADAAYHLFAGEETAAISFGSLLRSLPVDARVFGVVQANTKADHIPLPRDLTRIERNGASAASSQQLVDAVAALELPDRGGAAYLAGEARTIQMLRVHLIKERDWDRRNIIVKPFWTPGKRGME